MPGASRLSKRVEEFVEHVEIDIEASISLPISFEGKFQEPDTTAIFPRRNYNLGCFCGPHSGVPQSFGSLFEASD